MRRLLALLLMALLCSVMVAQAQEATPEPPDAVVQAMATQAADALERAESAIERAEQRIDTTLNLVNVLLASLGLAVTVGGVVIAVLGYIGIRQYIQHKIEESIESIANRVETAVIQRTEQASRALALLPIGERQYLVQDYSGALKTYQRALELHSHNAVIHYHIGIVHLLMNDLLAAETSLDRAIELDAQFLPARAARGYTIRRKGEQLPEGKDRDDMFQDAARILNTVLDQSPYLVDIDGQSWWGALGSLYRKQGKIDRAIDAYNEAARVTPFSSYPFSNLALLYGQKGDTAQMEHHYERVERLAHDRSLIEPNNYWWYTDLLASRLALGRPQADIDRALQDALDTRPSDSLYPVHSLVRALRRLLSIVRDERKAGITAVINRIESEIPAIRQDGSDNSE